MVDMKIITCACVLITGIQLATGGPVICNLVAGTCSGSDSQISISKPLVVSPVAGSASCKYMGQIRVNFGVSPKKMKVRVEYKMRQPRGHVYHIADAQEVNGYGGTQGAEIHGTNNDMSIFIAHKPNGFAEEVVTDQAGTSSNLLHNRIKDFNKHSYVRFDIRDQRVEWKDGQGTEGVDVSKRLYKKVHKKGDKSLWVSFNRVNSNNPVNRRGAGVCSVKVTVY